MAAYATLTDLKARLDFDIEPHEELMASSALEDLSDEAAFYGKTWTEQDCPPIVRRIVLKAAIRYIRNPDGYTQSRAGDETVSWSEQITGQGGVAAFLPDEIKTLQSLVYRSSAVQTVGVYAYKKGTTRTEGLVPTTSGSLFPFFVSDEGPW